MTLEGKTDAEKLKSLSQQNYRAQAIWFLNAFWVELEKETEKIWSYVEKIAKIDLQKGAQGNEVDEMQMHRFLETFSETMTVREMRDSLRSKGAIADSVKLVALVHYLIFRYNVDFHILVNASQGDNQKEIQEAQRKLDAVQEAYQESEKRAEQAKKALAAAKAREAEAKAAEVQAKAREAESKVKAAESKVKEEEAHVAKQELEVALQELKAQEDAFNNKTADLQKKSAEGSVVAQNKAKNELAQHLASDPLPLRKAKITQEAAVKKAERATKLAADARVAAEAAIVEAQKATKQAETSRKDSEKASAASEEAKREAEAAVEAMQVKMDEAEAFLNYVKSKPGKASGAIWFMERELHEKKKFMPERKGGIKKD